MAFGAQIFGSDGKLQADDIFFNLTLKTKGSGTATVQYGDFNRLATLTVTNATMPMVALRVLRNRSDPSGWMRGATIINTTRSGNDWTFTILIYDNANLNYKFDYWVYDKPPAGLPSGWGIWLGNGPGNTTLLNGQPILDLSSGATNAFVAYSGISYQENYVFDTNEMRDIVYYTYDAAIYWVWNEANGQVEGTGRQIIGGAQWGQPPNFGYENYGAGTDVLPVNVTGQ